MIRLARSGLPIVVLAVGAALLLLPLVAALVFGLREPNGGWSAAPLLAAMAQQQFGEQLLLTLVLALATTIGSFALLVPTLVLLHLRLPRLLGVAEFCSVLPYVVPAVALVQGANLTFRPLVPGLLAEPMSLVPLYMIIAMPLVYRSIDGGIRAMDLPTLYLASTSLGAGPLRSLWSVVLPNLRAALVTGGLLCVMLVFGEYALAALLLQDTFPVFLQSLQRNAPRAGAVMAVIVIGGTWLLLGLMSNTGRRTRDLAGAVGAASTTTQNGSPA